jgi:hypothetical protein
MTDFWKNSGFHLLEQVDGGHLGITDEFLRAYLMRPEVRPIDESCDAERALHASLIDDPKKSISEQEIDAMTDADTQENYRILLRFFERMMKSDTVEACYMDIIKDPNAVFPGLFMDQLVQVVLRNILDGNKYPLWARAAELLFREQVVTLKEGSIIVADGETVEMRTAGGGEGGLGQLVVETAPARAEVDMDVLREHNYESYWNRSEYYDTALDITYLQPGQDALCRVMELWIKHFLDVEVSIQPQSEIEDEKWVWHVGLEGEATSLLNDLYNEVDVDEDRMSRMLALFQLEFKDNSTMLSEIAGRPVYMAMSMSSANTLRLKPQNLLFNLPLAREV